MSTEKSNLRELVNQDDCGTESITPQGNAKGHKKLVSENERLPKLEKGHKCQICCKFFITPSKLKRHQSIHTLEKNFKCSVCNKSYTTTSNLSTHQKTCRRQRGNKNNIEYRHKCDHCDKTFSRPCKLARHLPVHN